MLKTINGLMFEFLNDEEVALDLETVLELEINEPKDGNTVLNLLVPDTFLIDKAHDTSGMFALSKEQQSNSLKYHLSTRGDIKTINYMDNNDEVHSIDVLSEDVKYSGSLPINEKYKFEINTDEKGVRTYRITIGA